MVKAIKRCELERITIIGMGPIGTAIAFALKRGGLSNTEIVATGASRDVLSVIDKMKAVDRTMVSIASAVSGASMVILDVPLHETYELVEHIGDLIDKDCVVTDTGTTKLLVMEWAEEFFPSSVDFVGGHPLIKEKLFTLEEAAGFSFEGIDYCVIPASGASRQSVQTVVGMVEMLKAKPLFLDPKEHDSYAVAMEYLPVVMSSALTTAITGSNSWREMHRLAAHEFGQFSRLAANDPQINEAESVANPEAMVYWIDQLITELYKYRNQIKDGDEQLLDSFVKAWEGRARWEADAIVENDSPQLQKASSSFATAFFGEKLLERYRKMTSDEDSTKKDWRYKRGNQNIR